MAERAPIVGLILFLLLLAPPSVPAAGLPVDPVEVTADEDGVDVRGGPGGGPSVTATPGPHEVRLQSAGAAGATHAPASPAARLPFLDGSPPASVAAAAAVAGLLVLALKFLPAFFTRLRRDALLEAPERARVFDAVRANPGIDVHGLARLCTTTRNNIRYHLGVLRRHGHVRAFRALRSWRFVAADTDLHSVQQRVLLEAMPRLRQLVDRIGPEGVAAHQLVPRLTAELGIPRSSGWRLLRQATRAELLAEERREGRLFLRPAATPVAGPA